MRLAVLLLLLLTACAPAASAPVSPEAPAPAASEAPAARGLDELPCAQALLAAPEPAEPKEFSLGPGVALDLGTPPGDKAPKGKGVDLGTVVVAVHVRVSRPSATVELAGPGLPRKALEGRLTGGALDALRAWGEAQDRARTLLTLRQRAEVALGQCKVAGCDGCLAGLEARLPAALEASKAALQQKEAALRGALAPGDAAAEVLLSYLTPFPDDGEAPRELLAHAAAAAKSEPASTELGSFARLWLANHTGDDAQRREVLLDVVAKSTSPAHKAHARWQLSGTLPDAEAAQQLDALVKEATSPELAPARLLALWRLVGAEAELDHGDRALDALQQLLALPEPVLVLDLAPAVARALRSLPEGKRRLTLPAALVREVALLLASERSGAPRAMALAALKALPEGEKNAHTRQAEADLQALDKDPKERARDALMRLAERCLRRPEDADRLLVKLRPGRSGLSAALSPPQPAAQSCIESQARAFVGDEPAPTATLELRWSP